jgi:hypothetical protein
MFSYIRYIEPDRPHRYRTSRLCYRPAVFFCPLRLIAFSFPLVKIRFAFEKRYLPTYLSYFFKISRVLKLRNLKLRKSECISKLKYREASLNCPRPFSYPQLLIVSANNSETVDPGLHAVSHVGLQPPDCWDRGFESRCSSLIFLVCRANICLCDEVITRSEKS